MSETKQSVVGETMGSDEADAAGVASELGDAGVAVAGGKLPYAKPTLKRLGTVAELTFGPGSGSSEGVGKHVVTGH